MTTSRRLGPAAILAWLAATLGFVLAFLNFKLVLPAAPFKSFSDTPEFQVMEILQGFQGALWGLLLLVSVPTMATLWPKCSRWDRWTAVGLYVVLAGLVLGALLTLYPRCILVKPYTHRLLAVVIVGFLVALPAVVSIWLVHAVLVDLHDRIERHGSGIWSTHHVAIVGTIGRYGPRSSGR